MPIDDDDRPYGAGKAIEQTWDNLRKDDEAGADPEDVEDDLDDDEEEDEDEDEDALDEDDEEEDELDGDIMDDPVDTTDTTSRSPYGDERSTDLPPVSNPF